MNPLLIKSAATAALAASLIGAGFAGGLKWQASTIADLKLSHTTAIDKMKLERKDEVIAHQRAARVAAERRVATQRAADIQAQARSERLVAVVDSNRTELERLRVITDATMRAASTNFEACVAHAATQGLVFNQCASRLEEVGRAADGHVSDIQTLMDYP